MHRICQFIIINTQGKSQIYYYNIFIVLICLLYFRFELRSHISHKITLKTLKMFSKKFIPCFYADKPGSHVHLTSARCRSKFATKKLHYDHLIEWHGAYKVVDELKQQSIGGQLAAAAANLATAMKTVHLNGVIHLGWQVTLMTWHQ